MIDVSKNNFEEEVINSKIPVLVDFNAEWCGPCRMMRPILEEISKDSKTKIVSVNIDNEEELAERFGVSSIPCLIFFRDGKEVNRSIGLRPKEEIKTLLGEE